MSQVAVCTLGCDRKFHQLPGWPSLLDLHGEYSVYYNYEFSDTEVAKRIVERVERLNNDCNRLNVPISLDIWSWETYFGVRWRKRPKFDQAQARLASIVCARNMCIEYAMQTESTHLLFIDGDIVPPKDIIPKLLEVDHLAVGGLVYGRGAHSHCPYIFGEKRRWRQGVPPYEIVEVEHGSIGFTMLSRKLFDVIRTRWGTANYPDGRAVTTSEDPAYQADAFMRFGEWMWIRTDVIGKHIGDLAAEEVSSLSTFF
jgi:hypothetical protein